MSNRVAAVFAIAVSVAEFSASMVLCAASRSLSCRSPSPSLSSVATMMNMLKSGLKAVEDGANTAVNVGKAAASGVVGSVKAAAEGSNVTLRLKQPHFTSGDVIEGWVDVDARIPLLAKGIDIRIQGYEKTEVRRSNGMRGNNRAVRPCVVRGPDSTRVCVCVCFVVLCQWHDRSERIAESGASQVGIPVFTRNRGKKVLFDTKSQDNTTHKRLKR